MRFHTALIRFKNEKYTQYILIIPNFNPFLLPVKIQYEFVKIEIKKIVYYLIFEMNFQYCANQLLRKSSEVPFDPQNYIL